MNFGLTQEQEMLVKTAHDFATKEIRPASAHHDETGEYPWEILKKAHGLGLLNTHVPAKYGGLGFGVLDSTLVSEEMAWGCTGIGTTMEANTLAACPLIVADDDAINQEFLRPMTEELKMAAYCVTEPSAGSDVAGIGTRARRVGDDYVLNGAKMWITNASVASWFFVLAYTDPEARHRGMTGFVVPADTEGIEIGRKEKNLGQRASDTRGVTFTEVVVPARYRLGEEGDGWRLAMSAFDHSRPVIASAAVGLAKAAMEHAIGYAKERKTFGKPIAAYQAVSFKIADMAKNIEAARLLTRNAAWLVDNGKSNTKMAAMAKAFAGDMAVQTALDAVQIFGGYGYNNEYPVEKLLRDSKIFQIYEGTSEIQRLIIAREVIGKVR
ncbi:MAG: acyl-CoA dehydrogenase [Myxococcales bacterium]|nr:acyl-CoA dehydrogenase [Myxococcales bacterium]